MHTARIKRKRELGDLGVDVKNLSFKMLLNLLKMAHEQVLKKFNSQFLKHFNYFRINVT